MAQVVSIAAKRTQSSEVRRASEMLILTDEFERMADTDGTNGAMKMIIGAWVAATISRTTLPNEEVACMLEELAGRFRA